MIGEAAAVVTSPCPSCTWMWLPRATLGRRMAGLPFEARAGEAPLCSIVTAEGRLGPTPYYPHPECSNLHQAGRGSVDLPVAAPLSPIKVLRSFPRLGAGPHVRQAVADAPGFRPVRPFIAGAGVDWDPELAERIAVIEALERDCVHRPPRARVVRGSALGADARVSDAVRLDRLHLLVETKELESGESVLLPLEFVRLAAELDGSEPIVVADSTGMAVHPLEAEAIENGLREVAERIALCRLWDDGPEVLWTAESLPADARQTAAAMAAAGFGLMVAPLSEVLGRRTCLSLLAPAKGKGPEFGALWGAGAGWTDHQAAVAAVTELYGQLVAALGARARTRAGSDRQIHRELGLGELAAVPCPGREAQQDRGCAATCEVLVVDRGNVLTDYLGLHARQVLVPRLYPWRREHKVRHSRGFPFF